MNKTQIFQQFLSIEINRRGLPYRTAIDQTAKVFGVADEQVAAIVLERASDLKLSAQELEWFGFPETVLEAAAKSNKPNWTPLELSEKMLLVERFFHETFAHGADCDCNKCMEYFGLEELLDCFSEDEKAGAVIAAIKFTEVK